MARRNYYKSPETGDLVMILITLVVVALIVLGWRWFT